MSFSPLLYKNETNVALLKVIAICGHLQSFLARAIVRKKKLARD